MTRAEIRQLLEEWQSEHGMVSRMPELASRIAILGAAEVARAMRAELSCEHWMNLQLLVGAAFQCPSSEMTAVLCDLLVNAQAVSVHEDVVDLLGDIADPAAVETLRQVVVVEKSGDDMAHHFNRKCVQALGLIGTPEAYTILAAVARESPWPEVRAEAQDCLMSAPVLRAFAEQLVDVCRGIRVVRVNAFRVVLAAADRQVHIVLLGEPESWLGEFWTGDVLSGRLRGATSTRVRESINGWLCQQLSADEMVERFPGFASPPQSA
jgi:hypothetical protein